jgi:flagellar biosynthesis GTPase FlhF
MERYLNELEDLKKTRIREKEAYIEKIARDKRNYEQKRQEVRATNLELQNYIKQQIDEVEKARLDIASRDRVFTKPTCGPEDSEEIETRIKQQQERKKELIKRFLTMQMEEKRIVEEN